jgi:Na+/glutamate symporter
VAVWQCGCVAVVLAVAVAVAVAVALLGVVGCVYLFKYDSLAAWQCGNGATASPNTIDTHTNDTTNHTLSIATATSHSQWQWQ